MKKILAVFAAAAILCACGCSLQTEQETTTEPVSAAAETTAPQLDDDLALPAINESGSTTAPVVAKTTQPPQTTAFVPAPALQVIEQAQTAPATTVPPTEPTTTAAPDVTEPDAPTTEKPTETTTQAPKTAELLQSAVLAPINSGTYTMTISAFGKDHSDSDKLSKIVRNGETAYWITIPDAGLTFKVFPSDGKYYLQTPSMHTELTKSQYDTVCKSFNNAFCNFPALKYQKTETTREGLKKYTLEYFDVGDNSLVLWYSGGQLNRLQVGDESLPMTVNTGADNAYFTLDSATEQVDYATLESLVSFAQMFFG